MNILGVYTGHDSHFCLLQDGQITRHYMSERWTRRKHEVGWIDAVLHRMLADAGVTLAQIDAIAIGGCYFQPGTELGGAGPLFRAVCEPAERAFLDHQHLINPMVRAHYAEPTERMVRVEVPLGGRHVPLYMLDHHLAHAAQGYYTSPFSEATVFSFDGGGDHAFELSCIGRGRRLEALEYNNGEVYPRRPSIGNLWSLILNLYRWDKPGAACDGEGKLMGHAAYGKPRGDWVEMLERCIRSGAENPRTIEDAFRCWQRIVDLGDFHGQNLKDLSASLQAATVKVYCEMINRRALSGPITISGGCAYNCCANGDVAREHPQMFVSNCPNDGGLAVGACLFVWHHVLGHDFNGVPEYDPFQGSGTAGTADPAVADRVVADLLAGKIVAWFNGRAETGSRALGHRSILADPRLPDVKEVLNARVKAREWYRPFAPSVLEGYTDWCPEPVPASWYMSFAVPVNPTMAAELPGVCHVDQTARPQVVTPQQGIYWEIIFEFRRRTGIPMILNTSFNVQEPIVETAEHARATFARSQMDVLYLDGERIER